MVHMSEWTAIHLNDLLKLPIGLCAPDEIRMIDANAECDGKRWPIKFIYYVFCVCDLFALVSMSSIW